MNSSHLLSRRHAFLATLLLAATLTASAADIIPADRLADWTPGVAVGVPGGIPTGRTNLIDVTKAPYSGDGPDKTIVMGYQPSGSIIGITPAEGGDWWYPNRLKFDITGSPKREDTELTVGDTKALDATPNGGIGQLCQLSLKDDPKLPVMATAKFDYMRRQISRIVKPGKGVRNLFRSC